MRSSILTFSAALVATVSAHGYVDNITIAGVEYTGYQPYQDPYTSPLPDRIVRAVQGNGPVEDITSIDLQCGGYTAGGVVGSSPAKLTGGPVAAGSDVSLSWTLWPESHMGPVITYMAKCASDDCTTYVPGTDAVWFKIAQTGRTGTSNVWGSTPLQTAGASYTYTIPSCLAAGSYIVRHEIIALHAAYAYPGAQFYPSCHQIQVTGSGTSEGSATKVAFPGAYTETDPGIVYDAYAATEYTLPGPELFTCDGSTASTGSDASAPVASASASASSAPSATKSASVSSAPSATASATPSSSEEPAEEPASSSAPSATPSSSVKVEAADSDC